LFFGQTALLQSSLFAAMDDMFAFNAPTFHDFDDNAMNDSMEMDPDENIVGKL
jgi:hypothetical protein